MPESVQAKFLRVIEQREVVRVGSTEPKKVDVRIVSATNRDLAEDSKQGRFREDLFFRLSAISVSSRLAPQMKRVYGADQRL